MATRQLSPTVRVVCRLLSRVVIASRAWSGGRSTTLDFRRRKARGGDSSAVVQRSCSLCSSRAHSERDQHAAAATTLGYLAPVYCAWRRRATLRVARHVAAANVRRRCSTAGRVDSRCAPPLQPSAFGGHQPPTSAHRGGKCEALLDRARGASFRAPLAMRPSSRPVRRTARASADRSPASTRRRSPKASPIGRLRTRRRTKRATWRKKSASTMRAETSTRE